MISVLLRRSSYWVSRLGRKSGKLPWLVLVSWVMMPYISHVDFRSSASVLNAGLLSDTRIAHRPGGSDGVWMPVIEVTSRAKIGVVTL